MKDLRRSIRYVTAAASVMLHVAWVSPGAGQGRDDATLAAMEAHGGLTASLVIVGPHPTLESRFGHSALWLHDAAGDVDIAYSYGFSISPGRDTQRQALLRGAAFTSPVVDDGTRMLEEYAAQRRRIDIVDLALSEAQLQRLSARLEDDARPSRPPYALDFYTANCTTGVRDAIDYAVRGQLSLVTKDSLAEGTYRTGTLRYLVDVPWLYAAVTLMLGPEVDRPLSRWDAMFTPAALEAELSQTSIEDEMGRRRALGEERHNWYLPVADREHERAGGMVRRGWNWMILGPVMMVVVAWLGCRAPRDPVARACFSAIAGVWMLACGFTGMVMAAAWLFTEQTLAHANANLLQTMPLGVILGLALMTDGLGSEREVGVIRLMAVGLTALALFGVGAEVLAGPIQDNLTVAAVTVPMLLGVTWPLVWWPRESRLEADSP